MTFITKVFNKKGQFAAVSNIFIGIATIAIITVVAFLVISKSQTQIGTTEGIDTSVKNASECWSSIACNATDTLKSSMDDSVSFMPLVVIAAIGAVLISLVGLYRSRQ